MANHGAVVLADGIAARGKTRHTTRPGLAPVGWNRIPRRVLFICPAVEIGNTIRANDASRRQFPTGIDESRLAHAREAPFTNHVPTLFVNLLVFVDQGLRRV